MNLSLAKVTKDFWLSMVNQFMVTSTREKQDGVYVCSSKTLKGKMPMR